MNSAEKDSPVAFRLRPKDRDVVTLKMLEMGETSLPVFCRSIVLAYAEGALIDASKNSDARFLGEKVASVTEQLESLKKLFEDRIGDLGAKLENVSETVAEATGDVYENVVAIKGITSRIEDSTSKTVSSAQRTELVAAETYRAITGEKVTGFLTIEEMCAQFPDRRTDNSAYGGVNRRSSSQSVQSALTRAEPAIEDGER